MNERSIFAAALDIADHIQRGAYLDKACGSNLELRRRLDELLAAQEKLGSFLSSPPTVLQGEVAHQDSLAVAGDRIGVYKLLQSIGEGGMGIVYMAEQLEPVRRKVAIKVIKPGMDSKEVLARFDAERQALALMDHPNIAKVLDACTTDNGRPYFVMELVKGISITKYCDDQQLTPRERLELFVPICQAIQHAHQKGVIHRDIKPSNVLIALYDGRPVPKVIDFGVAKAIGQQLTEKTLFTAFGGIIGTLEYMSPEQAELNTLDVDTRSDVYGLGVLLYELLTGSTPLSRKKLKQAALSEALRLIREEEPPKPSTRLSDSEALPSLSARRKTEPAKLTRMMRGELDWIVMKALEKDRTRRYESSIAMARDIDRYLHDEAVEACPPSKSYRFRKFVRKHKVWLSLAAVILFLILAGSATSTWQMFRAIWAEKSMVAAPDNAEAATAGANEERQRTLNANNLLKDSQQQLQSSLYAAHINLAQTAWETNNLSWGQRLLDMALPKSNEPDRRGFEWHFWNRCFHAELTSFQIPSVKAARFSQDGSRVAVLQSPGVALPPTVAIWATSTAREVVKSVASAEDKFVFFVGRIPSLAYDGIRMVYALTSNTPSTSLGGQTAAAVHYWNSQTGDKSRVVGMKLDSLSRPALIFELAPAGKLMAVAEIPPVAESTIQVWDENLTPQITIPVFHSTVLSLAFSPAGDRLAAIVQTHGIHNKPKKLEVRVWEVSTGKEVLVIVGKESESVEQRGLVFSPDGKLLAGEMGLVGNASDVQVWDSHSGEELHDLKRDLGLATCLIFSPDGRSLATAGNEGAVCLWEIGPMQLTSPTSLRAILKAHTGKVFCLAFSKDGDHLLSCGADQFVKTWDAAIDQRPVICKTPDLVIGSSSISTGASRFATAGMIAEFPGYSDTLTTKVWSLSGQEIVSFRSPPLPIIPALSDLSISRWQNIALSPDGSVLAIVSGAEYSVSDGRKNPKGFISVWQIDTGKLAFNQLKIPGGFAFVAFSPDSKRIASCYRPDAKSEVITILDARDGKELLRLMPPSRVSSLAFSTDGKRIAAACHGALGDSAKASITIWDSITGETQCVLRPDSVVTCLAFSPDGKLLVGGGNSLNIWDIDSAQLKSQNRNQLGIISIVSISPDGKRIATATDRIVKLWDVESGRELLTLKGPRESIFSMSFTPDGNRLHTVSIQEHGQEAEVRSWDATPITRK